MILNCNILRDFGREIGGMEEEFQLMYLASEIVDGVLNISLHNILLYISDCNIQNMTDVNVSYINPKTFRVIIFNKIIKNGRIK